MLQREDSPWYPSLKLYRQDNPGEWEPVLKRVRSDLDKILAGDEKPFKPTAWKYSGRH